MDVSEEFRSGSFIFIFTHFFVKFSLLPTRQVYSSVHLWGCVCMYVFMYVWVFWYEEIQSSLFIFIFLILLQQEDSESEHDHKAPFPSLKNKC